MSDMTPKRTARQSRRSEISPDDAVPTATAPAIAPEARSAAKVVSASSTAVAESAPKVVSAPTKKLGDSVDDPWNLVAEVQAALARGFEEIAVEVMGMTRSGIAVAVDAVHALLAARTFSEAVEIQAGLVRRGVDAMIEGAAKLSELGVKAMSDVSRERPGLIPGAR